MKRVFFTKRDIQDINKIVGLNLARARDNSGMSMSEVMEAIWGVTNNKNRICEIERGKKNLTLVDMLLFQELYGYSLDYLCGLSVEPEVDSLAGTVNHAYNQSQKMIDMLTENMAGVLVSHIKSVAKDDSLALLDSAKSLIAAVQGELGGKVPSIALSKALRETSDTVRSIETAQKKQQLAVKTQMEQRCSRIDKQDKHHMMIDKRRNYQYSIPLPKPHISDSGVVYE